MLNGCIDGMQHDLLAVAFAPFGGDDPADGDFLHVSTCRTYTSQSHNLIIQRQPQMDGILVITVQILKCQGCLLTAVGAAIPARSSVSMVSAETV